VTSGGQGAASMPSRLSGWGRTAPSVPVRLTEPRTVAAAADVVRGAGVRGVAVRGLGRSYGDAAQRAGGDVLRTTRLDRIIALDATTGVVTAEAGVSLDALMRHTVPLGWFPAVTPGTRMVTLGGALAADVHGKNHHVDGSYARHVDAFRLMGPDGVVRDVERAEPADVETFRATIGGMGLTGLVTELTMRLLPLATSRLQVDTERARDLDDVLDRLERDDHRYRYSVAWIDAVASGSRLGRGVITRGDHAPVAALPPSERDRPLTFAPSTRLRVPMVAPPGLLNRWSVAALNELWFRRAPIERRGELQTIGGFFHPLDGVGDWNRIYGPRGFVQYQYVVPFGAETTIARTLELIAAAGSASFLTVLKRFGPGQEGMLSFPAPGWTLALDLPVVAGLGGLLDRLDELVLTVGGRLYLAKDARMPAHLLPAMYPELDAFRAARARLDPDGRFMTDLARRFDL
jgi:decaprenylphospho-beta-D-ribofuranose 2-oxidase